MKRLATFLMGCAVAVGALTAQTTMPERQMRIEENRVRIARQAQRRIAASRADLAARQAPVQAFEAQTRARQQRADVYVARQRAREQRAREMQRRHGAYTGSADRTRYRRYDDRRNFYYRDNGYENGGHYRTTGLPPGLEKRNGDLPPGLAKRGGELPPGLDKRR